MRTLHGFYGTGSCPRRSRHCGCDRRLTLAECCHFTGCIYGYDRRVCTLPFQRKSRCRCRRDRGYLQGQGLADIDGYLAVHRDTGHFGRGVDDEDVFQRVDRADIELSVPGLRLQLG